MINSKLCNHLHPHPFHHQIHSIYPISSFFHLHFCIICQYFCSLSWNSIDFFSYIPSICLSYPNIHHFHSFMSNIFHQTFVSHRHRNILLPEFFSLYLITSKESLLFIISLLFTSSFCQSYSQYIWLHSKVLIFYFSSL